MCRSVPHCREGMPRNGTRPINGRRNLFLTGGNLLANVVYEPTGTARNCGR